jgi:hypothetical protein
MSEIKVDTLTGKTTATTVTGPDLFKTDELQGKTSAGDITVTSEGGAATQSLQQGLAKVWFLLEGDIGTPVFRDSLNGSSVTDNGTGDYTAFFSNSFNSHDNALTTDAGYTQNVGGTYLASSYYYSTQTNQRRIRCSSFSNIASSTLTDCEQIGASIFGDLA